MKTIVQDPSSSTTVQVFKKSKWQSVPCRQGESLFRAEMYYDEDGSKFVYVSRLQILRRTDMGYVVLYKGRERFVNVRTRKCLAKLSEEEAMLDLFRRSEYRLKCLQRDVRDTSDLLAYLRPTTAHLEG